MDDYGKRFNAAVAAELRAQRARVQMTFEQLAESAGISKISAIRYLNGQRPIPIPELAALARALDTSAPRVLDDAATNMPHEDD